ncbi:uncharacterized protein LOC128665868 isoform X2 [Bombina bombina]|uniref:uncharacterized protein LOC128665868 isoform X2 n=1 Tax=Bombina bombina TaxID=8345 RepID=UPI00235B2EE5|nr:uncharacterized protein LOC128665868 isoform X2 [Bombina bombina]
MAAEWMVPKVPSAGLVLNLLRNRPTTVIESSDTPLTTEDSDEDSDNAIEEPDLPADFNVHWKAIVADPFSFDVWVKLLDYVEKTNHLMSCRKAYSVFLSLYPYCFGYWKKYANLELQFKNKEQAEEVFNQGLQSIPISVDLWIHYINYQREHLDMTLPESVEKLRKLFKSSVANAGMEYRSDKLWNMYIDWETEQKNFKDLIAIYDQIFRTPTQLYRQHLDRFKQFITLHCPKDFLSIEEFKWVRSSIVSEENDQIAAEDSPSDDMESMDPLTDEERKKIQDQIFTIREQLFLQNETEVKKRYNFEEKIDRPYFHVAPLERAQLQNWRKYLEFEMSQGKHERIVMLFERCLVACAQYEEFWLAYIRYMESYSVDAARSIFQRACQTHLPQKPSIHLHWAAFEEKHGCLESARSVLSTLEEVVPGLALVRLRRASLERRGGNLAEAEKLLLEALIKTSDTELEVFYAIKLARFLLKVQGNPEKAVNVLSKVLDKYPDNPRLHLSLLEFEITRDGSQVEKNVLLFVDRALRSRLHNGVKRILSQRRLEFLEDHGSNITSLLSAYDEHQQLLKECLKRKTENGNDNSPEENKKSKTEESPTQSQEISKTSDTSAPPATSAPSSTSASAVTTSPTIIYTPYSSPRPAINVPHIRPPIRTRSPSPFPPPRPFHGMGPPTGPPGPASGLLSPPPGPRPPLPGPPRPPFRPPPPGVFYRPWHPGQETQSDQTDCMQDLIDIGYDETEPITDNSEVVIVYDETEPFTDNSEVPLATKESTTEKKKSVQVRKAQSGTVSFSHKDASILRTPLATKESTTKKKKSVQVRKAQSGTVSFSHEDASILRTPLATKESTTKKKKSVQVRKAQSGTVSFSHKDASILRTPLATKESTTKKKKSVQVRKAQSGTVSFSHEDASILRTPLATKESTTKKKKSVHVRKAQSGTVSFSHEDASILRTAPTTAGGRVEDTRAALSLNQATKEIAGMSEAVPSTSTMGSDTSGGAVGTYGTGFAPGAVRIWIVGHSYVHLAAIRAAASSGGQQLGFPSTKASVRWLGRRGMRWHELPTLLQDAHRRWGWPQIVVLHLGGNDVGEIPALELIRTIQADIAWLRTWCPGIRVGWSNMVARLYWRHLSSPGAGYRIRKKVNREVGRTVCGLQGFVVRHPNLSADQKELYRPDGVDLSEVGLDLFLGNIRSALATQI